VSNLRKRTMSAIMALLFVSMSLPGCLSLVIGREMMEGARGAPTVSSTPTSYDLSHTFVINTSDPNLVTQVVEDKYAQIPIDYTVQNIIIIFETNMKNEDLIPDELDERRVEVRLVWCDENGANCDDSDPIYHVMADDGSYPQTRTELDRSDPKFEDGLWELTVEGRGIGWNTGVSIVDSQDSWSLRVTVMRPCLTFPETPDICTPTIELND